MSTEQSPLLQKHRRAPLNVNRLHAAEQSVAGANTKIAVTLTRWVGTMWAAYLFTLLALLGLFGLLGWLNPFVFLLTTWISQQFLQLVFLPILAVGQNVLGRHAELMAEEEYNTTQATRADAEQIITRLDALAESVQALKEAKA